MIKLSAISLVIILSCCLPSKAQVPGFRGKKFSLYYYGSFYPRLLSPGYYDNFNTIQPKAGINYRHNVDADYVISKNNAVGFGFKTLKTGEKVKFEYDIFNQNYYYTSRDEYFLLNIKSNFFTVILKNFRHKNTGSIAPVGSYQKFEIGIGVTQPVKASTLTYRQLDGLGVSHEVKIPFPVSQLPDVTSLALFYSAGKQQVIANTFYIDYGLELGLIPSVLTAAFKNFDIERYQASTIKEKNLSWYKTNTQVRVLQHILFNVHIGIGIPLI